MVQLLAPFPRGLDLPGFRGVICTNPELDTVNLRNYQDEFDTYGVMKGVKNAVADSG